MGAPASTSDLPEFLPYTQAMDDLFVHLEAQKLPKVVHALLGAVLQNPINLQCIVGHAELASGAPRVEPGLYASKLLKKLLTATRALEWEVVADTLAHAIAPIEIIPEFAVVTALMLAAGEEIIYERLGSGLPSFLSGADLAIQVYQAMRCAAPP